MKNAFFILCTLLLFSCGKSIDTPATFAYDGYELVEYFTFEKQGDMMVKIPNSNDNTPSLDRYDDFGSISEFTLKDDGTASFDEYGDIYEFDYELSGSGVDVVYNGQGVEFIFSNDDTELSIDWVGYGPFDDNNSSFTSAFCGEYEECSEAFLPSWAHDQSLEDEGHINYIVVLKQKYKRTN